MKGKIDSIGVLYIERAGKMKVQGCPFQEGSSCGDWCSLFQEPKVSRWIGSASPDAKDRELDSKHWDLKLCRTTLYFDELVDDRRIK